MLISLSVFGALVLVFYFKGQYIDKTTRERQIRELQTNKQMHVHVGVRVCLYVWPNPFEMENIKEGKLNYLRTLMYMSTCMCNRGLNFH